MMHCPQTFRRTWILAVALLLAAPQAALADPIGFIARAEGTVEVQRSGQTSWAAAATDTDLEIGDTIRTGPDSLAKILLVDDTTLTVHDETELTLDEFVVGPQATQEPSIVKMTTGHVRTRVGEAFGGTTRFEMHTPTAVIGVKGTVFDCWVYEEKNEVNSLCCNVQGGIFMRNIDPSVGGEIEIPVGQCAVTLPRLAPSQTPLPTWLGGSPPVEAGNEVVETTQPGGCVGANCGGVITNNPTNVPGVLPSDPRPITFPDGDIGGGGGGFGGIGGGGQQP